MIPSPASQGGATKPAYVYLLRSCSSGQFYLGWTTNLQRRLEQHQAGQNRYTKTRGPWELVGYEQAPDRTTAKNRERTLKRNPRMRAFFVKRALAGPPRGAAGGGPRQVMG